MHEDWVIPLPPETGASASKGGTKQAVGLYPCINKNKCAEYILIKLDNSGNPYGVCSPHEVNIKGCRKRKVHGLPEDIPPQTYEAYQQALEYVSDLKVIPDTYLMFLEQAWSQHKPEEVEHESARTQDGI